MAHYIFYLSLSSVSHHPLQLLTSAESVDLVTDSQTGLGLAVITYGMNGLPGKVCHLRGGLGADTSINLQKTSIPCHTPTSSLSSFSSSLSPPVPHLLLPRQENQLVPRANEPNNKYLYFSLLPAWSISICHGFLSHFLNYLLVCVLIFPAFPASILSLSLSVCFFPNSSPLALQSSFHTMTCMSGNAYSHCIILCSDV